MRNILQFFLKLFDALFILLLKITLFVSFIAFAILLTWRLLYQDSKQSHKQAVISTMKLTSPAFRAGQAIPKIHSCDGRDVNPKLIIKGVSPEAKSLVLIVDDPGAELGVWTHWLVWNIRPQTRTIQENSVPKGAVLGTNDGGKIQWAGPCPPQGTHSYYFRLYSLDKMIDLSQGASRILLEEEMKDHVIGRTTLIGTYAR